MFRGYKFIDSSYREGINNSKFINTQTGEETFVQSKFVIGCDGVRSSVWNLIPNGHFEGKHSM